MSNVDIHARYVKALRTQAKTAEPPPPDALPCPFCTNQGRIFLEPNQLVDHAKLEHSPVLQGIDPSHAPAHVIEKAMKM
jgi:hypothetical protein